jgi:hypothetical protein
MLNSLITVKKEKPRMFQVLLLDNGDSDKVEVQEHLAHGGSVFITSKNSQKIALPKDEEKKNRKKNKSRKVTAFYFNRV